MRQRVLILLAALGLTAPVSAQVVVHTITVTTDASGDATAYSPPTYGRVVAVRYVPDGSAPLTGTATVTITDNATGLPVLTVTGLGAAARDFWPRAITMTTTGASALYAAGGTDVLDLVPVAGAVKVVVASGGATKSGTVYVYVEGR